VGSSSYAEEAREKKRVITGSAEEFLDLSSYWIVLHDGEEETLCIKLNI